MHWPTHGASTVVRSYARVLRAPQWVHFALLPFVGLVDEHAAHRVALRATLATVVACGALGFAYGLNAIADKDTDESADKNPLVSGAASLPEAWWPIAAAPIVALSAAASIGTGAVLAWAISIACAALYSVGPRLKGKPVVGTLLNLGIFCPLLAIAVDWRAPPPALAAIGIVFATLLLQNQLIHELGDAGEDARAADVTTGRVLGTRGVRAMIVLLSIIAAPAVMFVASSSAVALTGVAALFGGCLVLVSRRRTFSDLRRLHRFVSIACGAAVFVAACWTA